MSSAQYRVGRGMVYGAQCPCLLGHFVGLVRDIFCCRLVCSFFVTEPVGGMRHLLHGNAGMCAGHGIWNCTSSVRANAHTHDVDGDEAS